jgi:hypothetical protein
LARGSLQEAAACATQDWESSVLCPTAQRFGWGNRMKAKRRRYPDSPAVLERRLEVLRQQRFARYLKRWQAGKPVRTYDTRWLAFLRQAATEADTAAPN